MDSSEGGEKLLESVYKLKLESRRFVDDLTWNERKKEMLKTAPRFLV